MEQAVWKNYGALPSQYCGYKKSRVVLVPVPYERTTTYLKGTAQGPCAIIEASRNMEIYDEELEGIPASAGISTGEPVICSEKPRVMIEKVRTRVNKILKDKKMPVVLGGEHSVSIGFLYALKDFYPDLSVLHLDAHADMRDEYMGSRYNHACVIARMREHVPVVSMGIRSLSEPEAHLIREKNYPVLWDYRLQENFGLIKDFLQMLGNNVYVTLDLDVLDPALMPSVGTPEPGGLSWYNLLYILKEVAREKNVVGFDVVELLPNPANPAPDFAAAKLIYKFIGYLFSKI